MLRSTLLVLLIFGAMAPAPKGAQAKARATQPSIDSGHTLTIVRPRAGDTFVDEIFHRLSGELRGHGFGVRSVAGTATDLSMNDASQLLQSSGSAACLAVIVRGEASVVRVWVASSEGPPALFEAVALARTPDAPSVLAARAVDLLSAALNTKAGAGRAPAPLPPPTVQPETISAAASPPPPQPRFALGVGPSVIARGSDFGAAIGPSLVFMAALSPRWSLGVRTTVPVRGERISNSDASATLTQALAIAQAHVTIAGWSLVALRARAGIGADYLWAEGSSALGVAAVGASEDTGWAAIAAAGAECVVQLGDHAAMAVGGDIATLLPPQAVAIGHERPTLGVIQPMLTADVRYLF